MTCILQTVDVRFTRVVDLGRNQNNYLTKNAFLTMSGGAEQFVDVVQGESGHVTARALEQRARDTCSRTALEELRHRWQTHI